MESQPALAEPFDRSRNHLRAVAYRMLGSLEEATTRYRRPGYEQAGST
jgi:hypothetical protein